MDPIITASKERIEYYSLEDQELIYQRAVALLGLSKTGKSYLHNSFAKKTDGYYDDSYMFSATLATDDQFPGHLYCAKSKSYPRLDEEKLIQISTLAESKKTLQTSNQSESNMAKCAKCLHKFYSHKKEEYPEQFSKFKITIRLIKKKTRLLKMSKRGAKDPKYSKHILGHDEYKNILDKVRKLYKVIFADFHKILYEDQQMSIKARDEGFQHDSINLSLYTDEDNIKEFLPVFYVKSNYRTLVIINDLGDEFGCIPRKNLTPYKDYFNKGRHSNKTLIMLLQNVRQCPKELRLSFQTIIFTSAPSVVEFISNSGISGTMAKRLNEASDAVLKNPNKKYQFAKLIYDQLGSKFYYTTASSHDICTNQITSDHLRDFDRKISKVPY